jgi:hypothetical protein
LLKKCKLSTITRNDFLSLLWFGNNNTDACSFTDTGDNIKFTIDRCGPFPQADQAKSGVISKKSATSKSVIFEFNIFILLTIVYAGTISKTD